MEKIQSTVLTMKIGYCLIDSPFQYHLSYLNDNLNYKPPNHKPISNYGTGVWAMSKNPCEIKLSIPVNDGGAGDACFDCALKVVNVFDNIVTNNKQHVLTDKTLIVTYQNHVLNNANYSTYWEYALNNNKDL